MGENIADLGPLVKELLPQLPMYLAWFAGFVIALVTWQRHPMVSLLTMLAMVTFVASSVLHAFLYEWSDVQFADGLWNEEDIERFDLLLTIFTAIMGLVAWVMVLLAIFGWRTPREGFPLLRSRYVPPDETATLVLPPEVPDASRKEG